MREIWQRIEVWLEDNVPEYAFNPPASDSEIIHVESLLGVSFPKDFKDSLRIHNGQKSGSIHFGVICGNRLLPMVDMLNYWRFLQALHEPGPSREKYHTYPNGARIKIRTIEFYTQWIPFSSGHCNYFFDYSPTFDGTHRIISVLGVDEDSPKKSFEEWLNGCANALERGEYYYEDGQVLNKLNPQKFYTID